MTRIKTLLAAAIVGCGAIAGASSSASAGDYNGDFMVRIGGSVVAPDASATVFAPGLLVGADADVSTEVIPSATLTYFLNKNLAIELFCCFAKHDVKGKGVLAGVDLGDTWIFPPALTLQYHFDSMGGFKPYVGAGVQYIHFFSEGPATGLGGLPMKIDDAIGFTLQAGVDVELGRGWYLNADVKKTWLDTEASWAGGAVRADVELDPWIFSANIGYRFNLADIFGRREVAYEPMK
ncbi:MAG: outer membrane beta-barrel protein [Hyphomicrobiaceae bacterium]|nr:outer membrane beta-barrel protein [Hyphomicrobiaceae bacterium]